LPSRGEFTVTSSEHMFEMGQTPVTPVTHSLAGEIGL